MIYLCVFLYLLVSGLSVAGFIMEATSPDGHGRGVDVTYFGFFWLTVLSLVPTMSPEGLIFLIMNLVGIKWNKSSVAFKGRTR